MEQDEIKEYIRKIKTELRLSMNGVASAYMRENGLTYKLNFGVEIPRLKALSETLPHNHDLAQALWKENIRECKLLAGMLQPADTFYPEIADIWMETMPTVELAQHTVQNLFCRLPYASDKAFQWIADERDLYQICGYLILARLFMHGGILNEHSEHEFLDQVQAALHGSPEVKRAAISALQKFQLINEESYEKGESVIQGLNS